MKKILFAVIIVASFYGFVSAEVNMSPGLWEINSKVEIQGMPVQIPPQTFTQCITKDDVVPKTPQKQQNGDCKVSDYNIEGNTVYWSIKCESPQGFTEGNGKVTYEGDSFSGNVEIDMPGGNGGKMKMIQNMEGRRMGKCQ